MNRFNQLSYVLLSVTVFGSDLPRFAIHLLCHVQESTQYEQFDLHYRLYCLFLKLPMEHFLEYLEQRCPQLLVPHLHFYLHVMVASFVSEMLTRIVFHLCTWLG